MCIICADMSGQFRQTNFLADDIGTDLAIAPGQRGAAPGPLGFLDLDDRGGTGPNGKPSLTPTEAGAQITRSNARWGGGNMGDPANVTYAFRSNAPAQMPSDTSGFSRFSALQITTTELMLQAWSDVARVTFTRVGSGTSGEGAYSDSATMIFGNYSGGANSAAAFAYLPGNASNGANSGDVWVNSTLSYNSAPAYLAYGYQVLVHEIGHAIGLSHPGDYNAGNGSPTYNNASYYEDTRQYSVMSYWSESNTGGSFGGRYASAPLLDDIAAAQRLYGANMTTRTGDTVYGFNSTADRVWYNAGSALSPQAVIFAVWDAGGTDTLDFSGYTQAGIVDLRQGHFSSVGGLVGNVSIAMGAVIENAIGGSGADVVVGNSAGNRLTGGAGNDNIYGGNGSDTAVFSGNMAAYTITAGTENIGGTNYRIVTVVGPDGTDVLRGVEFLQFADQTVAAPLAAAGIILEGDATNETMDGTIYADRFYGADGNDVINGGDGDDIISGDRGNDTLNGGSGADLLDYGNSTGGVTVNLTTGQVTGAAGTDTVSGFETVRGSTYSDTITGTAQGEVLDGWGGIDTLYGLGGDDQLYARQGSEVGASDLIKPESQANLSRGTAVNIDGNFDQMNDPGVVNATTVPHAVIQGRGSGGGEEYYAFTVTAGAACVFDIASAAFDTTLRIFDSSGNQLAWNDDESSSTNSYLEYTFATGGTYYVAVGAYQSGASSTPGTSGPTPYNASYVLNVSVPGHSFVPTTGVGSTLDGGEGNDTLFGGTSNDTIIGGAGTDTVVLQGPRSAWTIVQNGDGSITASNGTQTDTLTGVEFGQFTDGTYALGGPTSGPDTLTGTEGDDTIDALAGDDTIYGLGGNDLLTGGAGADYIDGGAGTDTASYAGSGAGVIVRFDLSPNSGGDAQGDVLVSIENVIGSAYNDVFYDSSADNVLLGGDGNDVFAGGLGADTMDGGAGTDRVSYSQSTSAVVIRQDGTASSGGFAQGDILLNIETVTGSNYNDVFYGSTGSDTLQGLGGNDTFAGGLGADTMDGGSGIDRVSYSQSTAAVVVRQDGTASSGGFAQGDILVNIETVTGSAYNDVFYGSTGSDTLQGLAGNDTFAGGLGADTMDGGSGIDRVSYSQSTAAVSVRLDGVASTGGFAEGDILLGVENVTGSGYNDIVYGGAADNVLEGLQGFDILNGQDGNDTLVGGLGGDTLDGGNGIDTASYAGSISGVTVRQDGTASSGGEAQGDVLISVENVIGSAYNDVFYGSTADNVLSGGGGDDTFAGGLGADTMDGGSGIDRVSYSQSTAGITVLLDGGAGSGGFAQGDILVNIETVTGSGYNDTIYGNAADNLLQGLGGNDVLAGGAGNDTLQGGNGADRFVFASGGGSDVISDFAVSGGDMVELDSSLFTDFADVMTHTTDTAGGAVISKGGVTITLTGVTKAQLSAGHFDFVASAPVEPQAKAFGPLTLPGVLNDDPLVLPGEAEAKPMGPLTLIPLDDGPPPPLDPQDPLVLPVGLDAKAIVDDIPIICPTGTGGDLLPDDTGLAIADKAGQRDDHWILQQPRWIDWVA